MKIFEIIKQLSIKRLIIYIMLVLLVFAGAVVLVRYRISSIKASVVQAPELKYDPKELIENVDARLLHLQRRVTGASFYAYNVKMRDNLWKISSKNHYSVHSIIGCNPQFKSYDVGIKQRILLPSKGGVLHIIQEDDTWQKIAQRYKSDVAVLKRMNSNVFSLKPGEMVFIPGGRPDMDLMNEEMRKKYELRALFVSPLGGRLSSTFGKRRHPVTGKRSLHGGIDIAVRQGTFVGAAADGVVTLASTDVGHYGTAVFIEHQNGYETHYGHLSKILVRPGKRVKAHQIIGKSGSTGRSTGPHLHFTVKRNGNPIDPLKFLW